MTPEQQAAARARCEAATDGPWLESWIMMLLRHVGKNCSFMFEDLLDSDKIPGYHYRKETKECADSKFIAHARTDLPSALDALEKAESEVARLERGNAGLKSEIDLVVSVKDATAKERDQARAALRAVEGDSGNDECYWCHKDISSHAPDCQRQAALGKEQ